MKTTKNGDPAEVEEILRTAPPYFGITKQCFFQLNAIQIIQIATMQHKNEKKKHVKRS